MNISNFYRQLLFTGQATRGITLAALLALPAAAFRPGDEFYVTDVGVGGSWWYSDGVRWRAKGGSVVLGALQAVVAHSGTTGAAEKLFGVTIPAGLVRVGDILTHYTSIDTTLTDTNNDAINIRLGTLNSTSDPVLCNAAQPVSTGKYATICKAARVETDTTAKLCEATGAGGFGGTGTGALSSITIGSVSVEKYYGVYITLTAGNTRILTLRNASLTLQTCGS